MKNIITIFKHEYISRVSKKSFILMTIFGPLLIALFYGGIFYLSMSQFDKDEKILVEIVDSSKTIEKELKSNKTFEFSYNQNLKESKKRLSDNEIDVLATIESPLKNEVQLISKTSLSITDKQFLSNQLEEVFFKIRLQNNGINNALVDSLKPKLNISDQLENGNSSASGMKAGIGLVGAFIIYLFIFLYGVMVMRGVTEEKNNRIVEIIVSSVKPFELMMGKIIGITMVALTQFICWVVFSGLLISLMAVVIGYNQVPAEALQNINSNSQMNSFAFEILNQINSLNFVKIIFSFIFYFLAGFLFNSGLFAAIGSAVDNESETQQFMFPISMPLLFGMMIAQIAVIKDPHSTLSVWCSMIPFTSPVVMMVRIPFDVSWLEILASMSILVISFIIMVWLSSKIYKIGILSYGKKASYKQLFKWMISK